MGAAQERTMWHVIARQSPDESETVEYWTGASWSISRIKAEHWSDSTEAWEKCQELGEEAEVWGVYTR
jgi:hypothetical protein